MILFLLRNLSLNTEVQAGWSLKPVILTCMWHRSLTRQWLIHCATRGHGVTMILQTAAAQDTSYVHHYSVLKRSSMIAADLTQHLIML